MPKVDRDATFQDIHGHRIVSRLDPDAGRKQALADELRTLLAKHPAEGCGLPVFDGWLHESFAMINPRFEAGKLVCDRVGEAVAKFHSLSAAIADCKRRCPPDPATGVGEESEAEAEEGGEKKAP